MKLRKSTLLKNKELKLFKKGILFFNKKEFYNAHEKWEELWTEYKLKDPKFIQGMIQFSVGYFHFSNSNPKGAVGLLSKSIKKLTPFIESDILKIDIGEIVENSYKCIERINRGYKIERFTINLI